ncbi:MAG TPA: hypothetical protein VK530_04125 [Candidatus Acidoferrum sp.]|nr:hypothetical protein [Candidatus Acidoferrum sp.]
MDIQLSTLSVILGLIVALPSAYGLLKPREFAVAARRFPRHTTIGWGLMLMGTAWFLFNVRQEKVADFANMQTIFLLVFGGVGIATCIFVQDFLPVRGLAVLLLLAAKLMVDTARWADTEWRLVISTWAYVWAVAGMWFTISPWRLRDILNWAVATEQRTRIVNGARVAFGIFVILLGVTVFRAVEKKAAIASVPPVAMLPS